MLKVMFEPPWSIRIEDEAPLAVVAVTHGSAALVHESSDGERTAYELMAGDVAIARGPDHYVVADREGTEPNIVIEPGGRCRTLDGVSLVDTMELGVRTWGNDERGSDVMLVGTYQSPGEVGRWLLDALPPIVVLRAGQWSSPVLRLLATEIVQQEPGQQVVLDRLLDLVLVSALRTVFAGDAGPAPTWFSADRDAVVGPVIRLMQSEPAEPWTVAGLAASVGVSRRSWHAASTNSSVSRR